MGYHSFPPSKREVARKGPNIGCVGGMEGGSRGEELVIRSWGFGMGLGSIAMLGKTESRAVRFRAFWFGQRQSKEPPVHILRQHILQLMRSKAPECHTTSP